MKNEASGDVRKTLTNGEGFFSITAVQPGKYTVAIESKGFQKWEQRGLVFNAGDKRTLADISLTVGSTGDTVVVEGTVAELSPVDSGEKAAVISQQELQNVSIVGSNAAEFVKILPGMAMTAGATNSASFNGEVHGTGSGPVGSFSANGGRTGAMDITSDGAHIIDPGCNCGQAVDTNVDMTQELKVTTSNFGADAQKGPVVIAAVGKSGGQKFHGQAYFYGRDSIFNANDALNNAQGRDATGNPLAPKPATKYLYPGGNIGGPVIIPHTNFNKNHDKLFFFFAYEYYGQTVDNGIYQATVPTANMRNGNYSPAELATLGNAGYESTSNVGAQFPGGIIPASQFAGTWGQAMTNLLPLPNANPAVAQGYNYVNVSTKPQNAYQLRPRIDWSINDNTKLFVSYNRQRDTAYFLDTLWWRPSPTVPYPSRLIAANQSDSISANLTKVFTPTLTNELIFTYTNLNLPNSFESPSKVDPAALGAAYKNIFGSNTKEIPSFTAWGAGFASLIQPSGFQLTGALYAKKTLPTLADNMTKVWGTHTLKAGFYYERTANNQPTNNSVNGEMIFATWGGNSVGNAYADLLLGNAQQYIESNKDVLIIMAYNTFDGYATDSWKVSKRLTLDYGMRFSHLGPWNDSNNTGLAIFDPSKYNAAAVPTALTGIEWNKIDSAVPLSGTPSRALYYEPRFGMAWDIFGTGKTVMRGGYGMYRFHDEQNVQAGALSITQGAYTYSSPTALTIPQIAAQQASFVVPGSITVLDPKDNQQPMVQNYSFTISQRAPWKSAIEVSYVGSDSKYLSNWNNNFGQLNDIPYGTLYKTPGIFAGDNLNPNATPYRPYQSYGTLKEINHQMYSNYNSLQASWNKQSGKLNWLANYTFSKSLGVRGEGGAATGDPTNLANNYGVLPNDRSQVFNLAYIYALPSMQGGAKVVKGIVNGWQLSGITIFQSGVNLQAAYSANFGLSGTLPAGTKLPDGTVLTTPQGLTSSAINGSPDIAIQPVLTCNPAHGLTGNQFINPSCFALPTPGHNGDFIFPYIHGPAFLSNDLSVFKDFHFGESKKLQFRASGYNFLNHPLRSFIAADNNYSNLSFNAAGALSNPTFGQALWTTGHRSIQLALKFYF
jgi:hypothetical protein